ncbi:hypothetical protein ABW20_dc0100147 [Dactylellina cionopaga]|nr:hypothetical protein ABW20_dc0100147 [Dactylellina cionopaga]
MSEDALLPLGAITLPRTPKTIPMYRQRLYTPSSTPPPPHTPLPEEIAFEKQQSRIPQYSPEPFFDPVQPSCTLIYKNICPTVVANAIIRAESEGTMETIRTRMQKMGLGDLSEPEEEIPVDLDEYTIHLDGDYREYARTLMLKMLSKGIGAMHPDKIQRTNDMINDAMLFDWEKMVGITIWNLSRKISSNFQICQLDQPENGVDDYIGKNPFEHSNPKTRYLEALFRGFRQTWIDICLLNQMHIDFAEAVCRYLHHMQHIVARLDLEFLKFYARMFFLTSHGFWLFNYRLQRESQGFPLGVHCEHTLMDREKVPKMQIDYVLVLMNNENFNATGEIELPMEIIDSAGSCLKTLYQVYPNEESNGHNTDLLEHFARNLFSAGRQKLDILVTTGERIFGLDEFPRLDWQESVKIRAPIITDNPMGIFDPIMGDNAISFRLQFLMAMREKERMTDATAQSLKSYLIKLDPKEALHECTEVVPLEKQCDPQNLPKKVGEHPNVLIRLLVMHAYLRSPDRATHIKRFRETACPEPNIVGLMWWVFVKHAYQHTKPLYLPQEVKLFIKYEDWFLPLVKEHWEAQPDRCADILMGWFITGVEKYGIIVRHADQQNHMTLRQLFHHKFGIEVPIAFLEFHDNDDLIPIFGPLKHRVIVSAFSLLYYLVKADQLFHNEEVLINVIKTMAETFIRPEFYSTPEEMRPKGYQGVWKMGMEILNTASYAALEKAVLRSRDNTYWRHYIYMRKRLREYTTVAPVCNIINMFTEKPDAPSNLPRGAPRPMAPFTKVPRGTRGALGNLLQSCSKYLTAIFRDWESDDVVSAEMLEQREGILGLAMEGDVAADMLLKMDRMYLNRSY